MTERQILAGAVLILASPLWCCYRPFSSRSTEVIPRQGWDNPGSQGLWYRKSASFCPADGPGLAFILVTASGAAVITAPLPG